MTVSRKSDGHCSAASRQGNGKPGEPPVSNGGYAGSCMAGNCREGHREFHVDNADRRSPAYATPETSAINMSWLTFRYLGATMASAAGMTDLSLNTAHPEQACSRCGVSIAINARNCVICQTDVGFPNVRAAQEKMEVIALEKRVTAALALHSQASLARVKAFENAVSRSTAVVARSLQAVYDLVKSDHALDIPFHRAIESGGRVALDNKWDRGRASAESALFPNYHRDIVYCALSLDGAGARAYGAYSIVLNESLIAHRSSVFEENPFSFNQAHHVFAGAEPPKGYRSTWENRASVAIAKLSSRFDASTSDDDFSGILLHQGTDTGEVDCIEVHCFGSLHRRAIEKVLGPTPSTPHESWLCDEIERLLGEFGATLELT